MGSVYIGNRGGVPIITATPEVSTSNVIITLPNHIFRFLGQKGEIIVNLTSTIPSDTTTTFPVIIKVNDSTHELQNGEGTAITAGDMLNTLTFDAYFDKELNILRSLSIVS